jgi:hypothetical protein
MNDGEGMDDGMAAETVFVRVGAGTALGEFITEIRQPVTTASRSTKHIMLRKSNVLRILIPFLVHN